MSETKIFERGAVIQTSIQEFLFINEIENYHINVSLMDTNEILDVTDCYKQY